MKLHEIRKEYRLNQRTFYGWLREKGMIEKTDYGYVVGVNALEGMETLKTRRVDENGELYENTQVTMDNMKIPTLIELYKQSGLPKLYSEKRKSEALESGEFSNLEVELDKALNRITVLENQVLVLTKQLELVMKNLP
jgi:hypothetical protein